MLGEAHHARDPLGEAMRIIANEGRGVVVVLRQTRPTFVSDLVLRRGADDLERRVVKEYGVGAQILLDLGIKTMILLTDTPAKRVVALDGYGLNIIGTRPITAKETT
jgi:3,4-dihydroxy 2-butanone 4-phosphate synthase/GTP cyclohydrolase II